MSGVPGVKEASPTKGFKTLESTGKVVQRFTRILTGLSRMPFALASYPPQYNNVQLKIKSSHQLIEITREMVNSPTEFVVNLP